MRTLLALLMVTLSTAGCAVYTPSGSVVVDPVRAPSAGHGKFCPPGQAKKGNC